MHRRTENKTCQASVTAAYCFLLTNWRRRLLRVLSLEGAQRLERTACQRFSVQDTHPPVLAARA